MSQSSVRREYLGIGAQVEPEHFLLLRGSGPNPESGEDNTTRPMPPHSQSLPPSPSPRSHPMGSLTAGPSALLRSKPGLLPSHRRTPSFAGGRPSRRIGAGAAVAYMERDPNSAASLASRVIGALPLVGLFARIFIDEGGVGSDLLDFAEFRRRVGKKSSVNDSQAFYEFQERRGRAGDPLYVLLCCWLGAVGAGLLKSEEILEGVARVRISNDIEFEEQTFFSTMTTAKEKRAKLKAAIPEIPMVVRAEKSLEAIYVCCFGNDSIEEEDVRLLCIMLGAVFPSVERSEIDRIVMSLAKQMAEGERTLYPTHRTLSKEAVQRQMKDLQFLKENGEKSS